MELKRQDVLRVDRKIETAQEKGEDRVRIDGNDMSIDEAVTVLNFMKARLDKQRKKEAKKLAAFFRDIDFTPDDIDKLFEELIGVLRSDMDDDTKTEFDESSDDEQKAVVLECILDGQIEIGAVNVAALMDTDSAPETVTKH